MKRIVAYYCSSCSGRHTATLVRNADGQRFLEMGWRQ